MGRAANGGHARSDVSILSRSSRKCTVTGIDSHELQGLDVVQCAAIVETNHGIINLIMNEYTCYGKGHTIHSSGQIELLVGHKAPGPVGSKYAGLVSRESVRIALTYASLNGLDVCMADIRNAYLQSPTSEKHYILSVDQNLNGKCWQGGYHAQGSL